MKNPDESERLPLCVCPWCGKNVDAASHVDEDGVHEEVRPKSGDFSICMYCSHIMRFIGVSPLLALRKATFEDIEELPPDQQQFLARAAALTRAVQQQRIRKN